MRHMYTTPNMHESPIWHGCSHSTDAHQASKHLLHQTSVTFSCARRHHDSANMRRTVLLVSDLPSLGLSSACGGRAHRSRVLPSFSPSPCSAPPPSQNSHGTAKDNAPVNFCFPFSSGLSGQNNLTVGVHSRPELCLDNHSWLLSCGSLALTSLLQVGQCAACMR